MIQARIETPPAQIALDWRPNVGRIADEARKARQLKRADPFAALEAECWLELLDAELAARRSGEHDATWEQLQAWKAQLKLALRDLKNYTR